MRFYRRLNILVAEDNPTNQTLIRLLLERHRHRVTMVPDGREAVAKSDAAPFDVILMDVQMPEMDGFEATAAIRQRERATGTHIPIVAMTAHAPWPAIANAAWSRAWTPTSRSR